MTDTQTVHLIVSSSPLGATNVDWLLKTVDNLIQGAASRNKRATTAEDTDNGEGGFEGGPKYCEKGTEWVNFVFRGSFSHSSFPYMSTVI